MSNDASVLKVMMLEDMKTDQELIKRQVLKFKPQSTFTIANNRRSFLEKLDWVQPDIVISDYGLPDCNGLDALLHVKEKLPNIPFIFVTGTLNSEEEVANAILRGADGFVLKENLRQLPKTLDAIITRNNERLAKAKKQSEISEERSLLLQKLEEKVRAIEIPNSSELYSIIEELKKLK